MRRLYACAWSVMILALLTKLVRGSLATAQDPMPATVAALQTTVAGLSTTVARHATRINDLETAVAGSAGTPVASPTDLPEPESLEITISFRADPDDIDADGLDSECRGTGRFRDLAFDANIAIYDIDEELLVSANFVESELIHEGVVFHECEMEYEIEGIPYREEYIIAITNRSALTHDYGELEEMDWQLRVTYG